MADGRRGQKRDFSVKAVRWSVAGALAAGCFQASAHQALYHNVDLDLRNLEEKQSLELAFTIHAPELLSDSSEATSSTYDESWLENRTDAELNQLVTMGRQYLAKRFELRLGPGPLLALTEDLLFEGPELIRTGSERGLPPACLRATMSVPAWPGAEELQLLHSARSQKRLHLVVYRPESFPEVIEVMPGEATVVHLSVAPKPGENLPEPTPLVSRRLTKMLFWIAVLSLFLISVKRSVWPSIR